MSFLSDMKPNILASGRAWATVSACALAIAPLNAGYGQAEVPSGRSSLAVPAVKASSGTADGAVPPQQELQQARLLVKQNPSDPKTRFQLAELLRRSRRDREAAQEYLETTNLEPGNYLAFHQLSQIEADASQLDEAINYLTKLQAEKPKELMLRVALSELLEKRGNYYQAARVLVDLVYQNAVPDKYQKKVNLRIHYLLAKAKEAQVKESALLPTEEESDTVPAPLPESTLRRDLTASKIKDPRAMGSVGHAPLLP